MNGKYREKTLSILLAAVLISSILFVFSFTAAPALATLEEDIEQAVVDGIDWLVGQQDPVTGAWQDIPRTCFVLIKLQDRAYELGLDPFETDPMEPDYYEYAANVIDGWEYVFTPSGANDGLYAKKLSISLQDHTGGASGTNDDPDTRVNGYGIYLTGPDTYNTGIGLMALAASRAPSRPNDGGIDYDGDTVIDTFGEIAQDVVDWLAFAQGDSGNAEGGWFYGALDANNANITQDADNSNSGYAVLGLAAAEGFSSTVPVWLKTELDVWIDWIQNDQGPADDGAEITPDGGSAYATWNTGWVNELKTGNLLFEMTLYGDDTSAVRFQHAIDYIERHWNDANLQPGFRGDAGIDDDMDGSIDEDPFDYMDNDGDALVDEDMGLPNHYQAMYCLMKGFEYGGIDLLDLDNDNTPEHDWFTELATILVNDQNPSGSWPSSACYVWPGGNPGTMSGEILSTVWALLTLERIAPPSPVIDVYVDIKPGSWPNPINKRSKGVFAVAICGTEDFDVTTIDPVTIQITMEELGIGVNALRWSYEDVATPYEGEPCGGHALGGDGYLDLVLHFKTQEVVETLGLCDYYHGEVIPLMITGNLFEEHDGTPIQGSDCIRIQEPRGGGGGIRR